MTRAPGGATAEGPGSAVDAQMAALARRAEQIVPETDLRSRPAPAPATARPRGPRRQQRRGGAQDPRRRGLRRRHARHRHRPHAGDRSAHGGEARSPIRPHRPL